MSEYRSLYVNIRIKEEQLQQLPNLGVSPDSLTEADREIYHALSEAPYGTALAAAVAEKLQQNASSVSDNEYCTSDGLYHAHRDYCGIGLYFFKGKFTLGEVNDGMGPHPILATFDSDEQFVAWLAAQSDRSMSLIFDTTYSRRFNNQTITRLRLQWYLEEHYSPTWNAYAMYAREQSVQ